MIKDSKPPKVTVIAAAESAIHLRFCISDAKEVIRNVISDALEGMIYELQTVGVKTPFNTVDVNLNLAKDKPIKFGAKDT